MREMNLNDWTKWLDDQEMGELQKIAENPLQLRALEKVFCHEIYNNGILTPGEPADYTRNFLLSYISAKGHETTNEKLGQDVRSYWWGLHALQSGFKELEKFKREKVKEPDQSNIAI